MTTLFALPKPFHGHFEIIQRNAIASWTRLCPRPEIILFGDEEGTAQAAKELGVRHAPNVRRNEYGTPLLDDLFTRAQTLARHDLLCYVNADILLLSDFMRAVEQVAGWRNCFLMVGRRTNVDLDQPQDFDSPQWDARLRNLASEKGNLGWPDAIDYFVFTRGLYSSIPPFAVGRPAFDNWLIWSARASKVPVVDVSAVVSAIHQNHDYSHHPQGEDGAKTGEEAMRNRRLAGTKRLYTLQHATHELTPEGIRWVAATRFVRRNWLALRTATSPLRQRLGIRRAALVRFSRFVDKGIRS
jgi:hypothetical protein